MRTFPHKRQCVRTREDKSLIELTMTVRRLCWQLLPRFREPCFTIMAVKINHSFYGVANQFMVFPNKLKCRDDWFLQVFTFRSLALQQLSYQKLRFNSRSSIKLLSLELLLSKAIKTVSVNIVEFKIQKSDTKKMFCWDFVFRPESVSPGSPDSTSFILFVRSKALPDRMLPSSVNFDTRIFWTPTLETP